MVNSSPVVTLEFAFYHLPRATPPRGCSARLKFDMGGELSGEQPLHQPHPQRRYQKQEADSVSHEPWGQEKHARN